MILTTSLRARACLSFAALLLLYLGALARPARADDFLIPLDDRPANLLFVEQIYRIGSPQTILRVPPRYLLGRLLTPGDSDALIDWLDSNVKAGDTVFLSTDMWLYGGLVASRTSGIDQQTVDRRLERLARIGGRGVYIRALSTIPRLSLRTSDAEAPHEPALAKWAAKSELPSAHDLLEKMAEGDTTQFPQGVPANLVAEYLKVRERNVDTLARLIELCRQGYIDSLVLGQDDSNKTGLHQFEQRRLVADISKGRVGQKVSLISGIDEITLDLVAGELAARAGQQPTVRVVYSDPAAADKVPPLESLPLKDMVEEHLALAGARHLDSEQAEVDLYIYVPYSQPWKVPGEERRPASEAFVQTVRQAMAGGRRVAVADLSLVNRMDPFLAESALNQLSLPNLEGFASWNTPANTAGTVIAQVVCHQLAEHSPWPWNARLESEKTHQAFLLARFIDDFFYQTVVRDQVKGDTAGLSSVANPLLNLWGPVGLEVRVQLVDWARKLFEKHYLGRTFTVLPQNREVMFERSKLEVVLPWPRIFEVEARLDIRLTTVKK